LLNVKLDAAAKAEIEAAAKLSGVTVSEFVRRELRAAVKRVQKSKPPSVWRLLEAYCGKYETDDPTLSTQNARELMRARHSAKRTR
jgi:Ribbon-helix-helix protein, copG family